MSVVPNTFQTFNFYIDRAMELLTDSEFRVLMYATRHIMGWQERIDKRTATISLTTFVKGYASEKGDRFGGCGIGRNAVSVALQSLVEFGFLKKVGKPSSRGQTYTLSTNIEWANLETRHNERQLKGKQQIATATQLRGSGSSNETGTSNETGSSNDTGSGSSNETGSGSSNGLNQSQTKPNKENTSPRKRDAMFDAISSVFNTTAGGWVGNLKSMMLGTAKKNEWARCNFDPPVTDPQEVLDFGVYMRKRMAEKKIAEPITACVTIQRWFYDYREECVRAAAHKITQLNNPTDLTKWESPDPFAFLKSEGA